MLSYYNGAFVTNFTWRKGRELASTSALGRTVTYTYNDQGIRTSKTVDGVVHTYTLDGSRILSEEYGGKLYLYFYDESGAIMGFHYRDNTYAKDVFDTYFYEKTYLGDVIGIYDENGTRLAWYMYDAWGNVVHSNCATGYTDLMNANPFRYRGYYFDTDTGLYYLNSRYYNPILGRFINADEVVSNVGGKLLGNNLYAYCFNDPINKRDPSGNWPEWLDNIVEIWKEESFLYNVLAKNVSADAGVGVGMGGEVAIGPVKVSAISRMDMIGAQAQGIDVETGHFGKSSISVGAFGFGVGVESQTYESFDMKTRTVNHSVPEIGFSLGGELGFVAAVHANVSVSFSGIYNSFVEYGRERAWWQ